MDIKNCSTALFVKNIEHSKKFYIDILGFTVDMDFGKNVIFKNGLTIWEINPHHIIPSRLGLNKITDSLVNRFELYIETNDLLLVYEKLKQNNVCFLHEIHEESWGQKTVRFFDPDNHLIEVGESLKIFISRLYNQGLSINQVSEQTGVHVENIKQILKNS